MQSSEVTAENARGVHIPPGWSGRSCARLLPEGGRQIENRSRKALRQLCNSLPKKQSERHLKIPNRRNTPAAKDGSRKELKLKNGCPLLIIAVDAEEL